MGRKGARSRVGLFAAAIFVASACGLDVTGTLGSSGGSPPPGVVDGSVPGASDGASSADGSSSLDGAADAPDDAAFDGAVPVGVSCADIHAKVPAAPSNVYSVDPDGPSGAGPFSVRCDMTTAGGGWTLVGRELANEAGHLPYLDADSANSDAVTAGTASGLFGKRFVGKYVDVWIDWASTYIRFTRPAGFDLFANVIDTAVAVTGPSTNDAALGGWFTSGGGAVLCVASKDSTVRPGDTSWAVKPKDDTNTGCGCSSPSWKGRGAYYSGLLNSTSCGSYGGGWSGVKDDGAPKTLTPTYETRLWIR